jgi:hypothetical protein
MPSHLTDPLKRRIVLHDHAWAHVLKGHPEVGPHRAALERAISNPTEIRHSASDMDCRLYAGPVPGRRVNIVVVVDVAKGVVKTAYLARKASGGVIEWSSPKP